MNTTNIKKDYLFFFHFQTFIIIYNYIIKKYFNIVAMINKNIIKIRKELDKLDDSLLAIIKKRSLLVDKVIKNKNFKKDIIDKKRISIILKNIYKKSKIKKIDTTITKKIWVSMIRAFIDYEFRNFKKKK